VGTASGGLVAKGVNGLRALGRIDLFELITI
jgi:hypothetical protein